MRLRAQAKILARLNGTLNDRMLVVVSNRQPFAHQRADGEVRLRRSAGGLATTLDPVLKRTGGRWIAWGDGEADFEVAPDGRLPIPPQAPAYTLQRLRLSPLCVWGYYDGYANQVLWPLCHMALEKIHYRRVFWALYEQANLNFAAAVAGSDPDAIVWVHDYHLALCPGYVRAAQPDRFLMHFWHIPWPAWDVFRLCPQRNELLEGLLGSDLIGFQRPRDVRNFLDCVERGVGSVVDRAQGLIEHRKRIIGVKALPISVDVFGLDRMARSLECTVEMERLRWRLALQGRRVVVSVDRLDYTKGILERLQAIDCFLTEWPAYRGHVTFVQKVAPTRDAVPAYQVYRAAVERLVEQVNARHATNEWKPVIYLPDPLPRESIIALYRLADVCVVSSLEDGMNLVAKEFIASQIDKSGVLVLSEFAGAHTELPGAFSINPYDVEGCAEVFRHSLELSAQQCREHMSALREHLAEHDVYRWVLEHFEAANRILTLGGSRSFKG